MLLLAIPPKGHSSEILRGSHRHVGCGSGICGRDKGKEPSAQSKKKQRRWWVLCQALKDGSEGKPGDPGSRRKAEAAVILALCTCISRAPEGLQPEMSIG